MITLLIFALLLPVVFFVGVGAGYVARWPTEIASAILKGLGREAPKALDPHAPICGCGHHSAFHEDGTGKCRATIRNAVAWDYYTDEPTRWKEYPCECQHYVGPEPLPAYYA